ncbi:MAG: hypothetical protein IPN61_00360 [Bacteroidetes bacterium]|nr:hypothetical protein [Bacteroidota bacterium]
METGIAFATYDSSWKIDIHKNHYEYNYSHLLIMKYIPGAKSVAVAAVPPVGDHK